MLDSRESIHAAEIAGTTIDVERPLRAMCPTIDHAVIEFINFARCERLPVTSNHIKPCDEDAAKRCKIQSFCASIGCLLKFLLRSPEQSSFKMHEKPVLPSLFELLTE